MRKHLPYFLFLTVPAALLVSGCRLFSLVNPELEASPAPTALPLPTTAAPPSAPSPTDPPHQPTRTPETVHSEVLLPTRVMEPRHPLVLPPGFGVSLFAGDLQEPRMLTLGPDNHVYAVEREAGRIIRLPDRDGDGVVDRVETAAENLNRPSGLAFHPDGSLYAAETTRVYRLTDPDSDGFYQERQIILDQLPSGGHTTRTLLFSPDGAYLYVSIGSSCNVCREEDYRRATVMRYKPDGTGEEIFADGLRNAVGITFRPGTEELWATNNGRDWLGDNQPPDTVHLLEKGSDAGWPWCHAGRVIDPEYGEPGSCQGKLDPVLELQAHSAPLGLTFYRGDQFPPGYHGDLLIAYHGSWNRSVPTGYKIVRVPFQDGQPGPVEDFLTGWLLEDGSHWGRPVDVLTGPDGSLLISDDGGGSIYRVFYHGN
jgi:glucose/arabinose dehydrogenase